MNLGKRSDEAPITANRRRQYQSLTRAKGRDALGQYLVEGVRAVESALDGGAELVDVVSSKESMGRSPIAELLSRITCPLLVASTRDLERMSGAVTTQGLLAAVRIPQPADRPQTPCLVLDGLQDPGNVGTLIRTAAWYGVCSVVCGPGTANPYQPKVVRSTQGGLWDLEVMAVNALDPVFEWARGAGHSVYIADMEGEPARAWHPKRNSVLVIGSEARGPSQLSREAATGSVYLLGHATTRATESLNAAVAGGILLDRWLAPQSHPSG